MTVYVISHGSRASDEPSCHGVYVTLDAAKQALLDLAVKWWSDPVERSEYLGEYLHHEGWSLITEEDWYSISKETLL